jgi:dsRNA-specific ribonuclease
VESLICALYLSSGLKAALNWINDINLVPLKGSGVINKFEYYEDYTFGINKDLEVYGMSMDDYVG